MLLTSTDSPSFPSPNHNILHLHPLRPWRPRGDAAAEVDLEALDAGDDQKHGDGRERTAHAGYGVEQVHLAEVVRGHDSAAHGAEWPQGTSWSRHTSR